MSNNIKYLIVINYSIQRLIEVYTIFIAILTTLITLTILSKLSIRTYKLITSIIYNNTLKQVKIQVT